MPETHEYFRQKTTTTASGTYQRIAIILQEFVRESVDVSCYILKE